MQNPLAVDLWNEHTSNRKQCLNRKSTKQIKRKIPSYCYSNMIIQVFYSTNDKRIVANENLWEDKYYLIEF